MQNNPIRLTVALLFIASLALPVPGMTQEAAWVPVHEFGLSAGVSYFDYEEDSLDVSIDGPMYGIAGRYAFHSPESRWMFGAQAELNYGRLEYDGATQAGTPVTADSDDVVFEVRGLAGLDFEPAPNWLLTPYLGIGYRYWHNDVEGRGSYTRQVQYLYLPLGVEVDHNLGDGWRLRLAAEGDILLSGQVDSELSDVNPGFNDTTNDTDFGDGWGARVSLEAQYDRFSIAPYFQYWDIDDSDTDVLTFYGLPTGFVVFEPANTTTVFGIRVAYYF